MINSLFFFIIATYASNIVLLNEGRPIDNWHINTTDSNTRITRIHDYKYLSSDLKRSFTIFNQNPIQTSAMKSLQFLFYVQPKYNEHTIPIDVEIRYSNTSHHHQNYMTTFHAYTNQVNKVSIPIGMNWIDSIRFRVCEHQTNIFYDYLMGYIANMQMADCNDFLPWQIQPRSEEIIVSSVDISVDSVDPIPSVDISINPMSSIESIIPPTQSSNQPIYFQPVNWICENGSTSIFIVMMMICFFIFI